MADFTLIVGICAKVVLIIISSIILSQLNPAYVASYKVVFIYVTSAMTLIYCVATMLIHIGIGVKCPNNITSFAIGEICMAGLGIITWLFVSGVAGSTAWRSGSDDSLTFGWICGLAGVICIVFLSIVFLFCARIGTDKMVKGGKNRNEMPYYNR